MARVNDDRDLEMDMKNEVPVGWSRGSARDLADAFEHHNLNGSSNGHRNDIGPESDDAQKCGDGFVQDVDVDVKPLVDRSFNGHINGINSDSKDTLLEHEIIRSSTSSYVVDKILNTVSSSNEHIENILSDILSAVCPDDSDDTVKCSNSYTSVSATDLLSCTQSLEQVFLVDNAFGITPEQPSNICDSEKLSTTDKNSWQSTNLNEINGNTMFGIDNFPKYVNPSVCTTCQLMRELGTNRSRPVDVDSTTVGTNRSRPVDVDSTTVYDGSLSDSKGEYCGSLHVVHDSECACHSRQFEKCSSADCGYSSVRSSGNSFDVERCPVDNSEESDLSSSPLNLPTMSSDVSLCLDDLPDELLLHIFSFLSPRELSQHAAPICRKWHELSHDPLLWQTLCFDFNPDIDSCLLEQCIKQAPLLKRLYLNGRNTLTVTDVEQFAQYCPKLCHLDLGFCDNLTPAILYSFIRHCRKLEAINLEGCRGIDSKCVDALCLAPLLRDINLSYCLALADESIIKLASYLPVIRRLNIDGISFTTDSGCLGLLEYHRNNLRILELDGAEQTDVSMEAISECRSLRTLSVSFALQLTDLSFNFISELPSLRELKLRKGEAFTSAGLANFLTSPCLSNLTTLDLGECKELTDEGVFNLARNCGSKLHFLALCWCWYVTERGLIAIVDHCSRLVELNLLGIDNICGECLDRIPEEMMQLKFLDLRQCRAIMDEIIEELIKRKPDLKVLNYYGEEFVCLKTG